MFLFCLLWNVALINEGVNFIKTDTNNTCTGPTASIQNETNLENCPTIKRKRNLSRKPDQNVEVLALSLEILMATNRYLCEFCKKGFKREQNLHLHKRTHKVEYKLKPGSSGEIRKKVYVCPEPTCKHHHPSKALGDLTGIKKHYLRKHGPKNWKCEKCSKFYAVESDLKSHSKKCGTSEYKCDCGTIFLRKDSFLLHKYRCVTLEQETARITANTFIHQAPPPQIHHHLHQDRSPSSCFSVEPPPHRSGELFYSNPNLIWDPVTSNPTPFSLEPQAVSAVDSLPPPHGYLSASLNPNAVSFRSQMVGDVGSSSGFGSKESNTWDFHSGDSMPSETRSQFNFSGMAPNGSVPRQEVNFSGMAPYQGNLTDWGQRGDDFSVGAGPSWK